MRLVVVESPFASSVAGGTYRNLQYAKAAMRDCLARGEAPFASHLLYTQDGVLNDDIQAHRRLGIEAGVAWGRMADATVVYDDLGISSGMKAGIARAVSRGRKVEYRQIPGWGGIQEAPKYPLPAAGCAELQFEFEDGA